MGRDYGTTRLAGPDWLLSHMQDHDDKTGSDSTQQQYKHDYAFKIGPLPALAFVLLKVWI